MRMKKGFLRLTVIVMTLITFLCSGQQAFAMEILDKFSPNEMTDTVLDSFGDEASNDVKADIEQSKLPVFFLVAEYEGEKYLFHCFYVKDTYGTGGSYLVSSFLAYAYAQSGANLYVIIDGVACKAECLGGKNSVSYLKCSEMSKYTPIDLKEEVTDPSLLVVQATLNGDEKIVLKTNNLDISSWKANNGYYASGEKLSNVIILGIPLLDKNTYELAGMLEVNAETSEVVMLNLTQTAFEGSYALATGTPKERTKPVQAETSEPSKPEASATTAEPETPTASEPSKPESSTTTEPSQPVTAEPEKTESKPIKENSTSSFPEWAYIAVVIIIGVAVYLSKNKKKQEKKKSESSGNNDSYPKNGTINLNREQTVNQEHTVKNEPAKPLWQIRGMSGTFMGQTFALTNILIFGRNPGNQIVFPQNTKGISGNHCELTMENGRIILRDLGSTYGTFLNNGEKINERVSYEVKEGDIFYLAERSQSFRVERIGESRQQFTPAVKAAMYPKTGEIYRADANGRIQFGRSANSQVSFGANDTKISTNHCIIYRENNVLYLKDLGSTNGTYFSESKRLQPNVAYRVEKGMAFYLTSQNYLFVIVED